MPTDPFNLERFIEAQRASYDVALAELGSGCKRTHWIWFIFPQLKGLGVSSTSERYGLSGLEEARAYLAHPILGPRLREAVSVILEHSSASAGSILGELDALKLRSCLTLFALADPAEQIFEAALERFFDGQRDGRTLDMLGEPGRA